MFRAAQYRCVRLSAALLCAGCSMVPAYQRPASALPEGFKEAPGWRPAAPADNQPRAEWWTWLADRELDALQARVLVSNQNLAAATLVGRNRFFLCMKSPLSVRGTTWIRLL